MIRINLLAEGRGKKKGKAPAAAIAAAPSEGAVNPWPFVAVLILIGLLSLGWWAWTRHKAEGLRVEKASKQKELEKYKDARKRVEELELKKEEYTAKVDQIKKLKSNQSLLVSLMNHLVEILPDGAWYENLDQRGNAITLKGNARSIKTISTLYDNMVSLQDFTSVLMGDVKKKSLKTGEDIYEFSMEFSYVPGGPQPAEGEGTETASLAHPPAGRSARSAGA